MHTPVTSIRQQAKSGCAASERPAPVTSTVQPREPVLAESRPKRVKWEGALVQVETFLLWSLVVSSCAPLRPSPRALLSSVLDVPSPTHFQRPDSSRIHFVGRAASTSTRRQYQPLVRMMSPPMPSQLGTTGSTRDSGVDFVLLDLTNSIDASHARQKEATPVLPLPSATKPDYVVRRIECWNKGFVSEELLDVSTSLPLGPQAAFRRKLLLVLALQLFAVWVAVGLGTFHPPVRDRVIPVFVEHDPVLLGAAAVITFVLLGVLYYQRTRRYVNILILMWFSAAQAATFVGLGVTFDTHIGFFNCGATFTWVLLMVFLVNVRVEDGRREGSPIPGRRLISPLLAGALAFAAVVCASCALFMIFGSRFVTTSAFGYSLVFQFALLGWFTWDATCMFEVVAVDEFAYGVIYIYTDIVLSFLFSVAAAGVAVGFTSLMVLMFATGGDGPDPSCCCDCCEFGFNCCCICIDDGWTRPRRSRDCHATERDQRMERV